MLNNLRPIFVSMKIGYRSAADSGIPQIAEKQGSASFEIDQGFGAEFGDNASETFGKIFDTMALSCRRLGKY